jgi:DNA-binding NarL/FixJ family response regulator
MRHAELITYGIDDAAAEHLQAVVRDRGVGLRVTRHAKACLNHLRQGAVGVLVLRVGRDLETEFALLAQVTQQFPDVAAVVWTDGDHPRLVGLAWDLGARAVFLPPHDPQRLHDFILRLLPE